MPTIARLSITPVKGLALHHPDRIRVERTGVPGNREFFLVDRAGRLFNAAKHGEIMQITAEYDADTDFLTVHFPDGATLSEQIHVGEQIPTNFWGRGVPGRYVNGSFADAFSSYVGRPVRLVRATTVGGAFDVGVLTFLSDGSVAELARQAGTGHIDPRRFRMLVDLAGCEPHEEDTWNRRAFRIGTALVRFGGPVPRCVITTKDPDTGLRDFDALREIKNYRGLMPDGEGIPFGVYATVEEPGELALGDELIPE
ncbi:MAG TPA: MOSC N-terminal beta barrel domain-containing protein [Gaiellaceae bacterium]|jgi:hypothetical protein